MGLKVTVTVKDGPGGPQWGEGHRTDKVWEEVLNCTYQLWSQARAKVTHRPARRGQGNIHVSFLFWVEI